MVNLLEEADAGFKNWILDQKGYITEKIKLEDGTDETFRQMVFENNKFKGYEKRSTFFKHKSRIYPKEINVTIDKKTKKKTKVQTDQKQII